MEAVARARKPRSVASKDTSLVGLIDAVEDWLESRGRRDIAKLLGTLAHAVDWKTAPHTRHIAQYGDLFERIAEVFRKPIN